MRNEYNELIAEEDSLTEELSAMSASVGIWEAEPLHHDERSHRSAGGESSSDASNSRVRARQAQMLEYHGKIGALDRKVLIDVVPWFLYMSYIN